VAVAALGASYGVPWNVGLVVQPGQVVDEGALIPALVAQGEWWRLLSSMFLHSGAVHLGLNMLSLYFLGSFIEVAFGLRRGTFSWQNPLIRQLLILLALNLYIGFSVPNISNTAHLGGLAGGFAFGWLVAPSIYSRKKLRAISPIALVLGAEILLLAAWFLIIA
jgi:rhomboid protease GluP